MPREDRKRSPRSVSERAAGVSQRRVCAAQAFAPVADLGASPARLAEVVHVLEGGAGLEGHAKGLRPRPAIL